MLLEVLGDSGKTMLSVGLQIIRLHAVLFLQDLEAINFYFLYHVLFMQIWNGWDIKEYIYMTHYSVSNKYYVMVCRMGKKKTEWKMTGKAEQESVIGDIEQKYKKDWLIAVHQ